MGRTRVIFPLALACSLAVHLVMTGLYVEFGKYLLSPTIGPIRAPEMVIKVDPQLLDFGDAAGTGIGSNSSPGEHPMRAREGDENQALLDRQPSGLGKLADVQSKQPGPPGEAAPTPLALANPAALRQRVVKNLDPPEPVASAPPEFPTPAPAP